LYPRVNRDLLLLGGFLHDIGKIDELSFDRAFQYSDEGRLLGHLALGVLRLEEKIKEIEGFLPLPAMLLKHLILSHHGERDFGAVKRPKTLEAMMLHLVDDLDAKLEGVSAVMDREAPEEGGWTGYHRLLDRYFLALEKAAAGNPREEG
jgi:3'-5' exoribonuclease